MLPVAAVAVVLFLPAPPVVREVEPTQANLRAAVGKALPPLWKGMDGHNAKKDCFACHHHSAPLLAITTADRRGFPADRDKLAEQTKFITDHFAGMKDRLAKGTGPGPSPVGGGADTAASALLAFDLLGVTPNDTTAAVAAYTLAFPGKRDHWRTTGNRPPSEASDFTTTALAVRGVRKYAPADQEKEVAARVEAARGWLRTATAKETEDKVFRLIGLAESGAADEDVAAARKELLDAQNRDGGWSQTDDLYSDAYATGSALYALATAGGVKADDPAYKRGLAFLLGTQLDDGTWHVRTRSKPVQRHYESGFPHGKDQFLSSAATGWAAAALALACEKK